jgi:uncharacterized tellurite resistance protein B-like protein
MNTNKNYQLGLLSLVHLLMNADGVIDENEKQALVRLKLLEQIPEDVFEEFSNGVAVKKQREIYEQGIHLINQCSDQEKLKDFVHLYKMTEVDGHIHVKEVRLLLYSIKMANIEFSDVIELAKKAKNF